MLAQRQRASSEVVIALDVGGSFIKSGIIGLLGTVIAGPLVTPIDSRGSAHTIISTLTSAISQHLPSVVPYGLHGLAIALAGRMDYPIGLGRFGTNEKFGALNGVNIRSVVQERLSIDGGMIVLCNDAEAATIGEAVYGAGRRYQRFLAVTLGTDLGLALMADGAAISLREGLAPADSDGSHKNTQVANLVCDFSSRHLRESLRDANFPEYDISRAAAAARRGNAAAQRVFEEFGQQLGTFLDPFACIYRAEAVVVMGGIAGALDLFSESLSMRVSKPLTAGELSAAAALVGAAHLLFKAQGNID